MSASDNDSEKALQRESAEIECPGCEQPIASDQVLCVNCGFHLVEKRFVGVKNSAKAPIENHRALDKNGEAATDDWKARPGQQLAAESEVAETDPSNPFAPPQPITAEKEPEKPELLDMDLELAHDLRFVVSDWRWVAAGLICSIFGCLPVPVFMFPWYAYKAYLWHRLYHKHDTLQNPNSFAAYGTLAAEFKDSRKPILAGAAIGLTMWFLMGMVAVIWPR